MVVCKLSSVDKFYKSPAGDVHALKKVDCEINEGEFVVLAGPSGAGKTTMANILGLLDNVSAGHYFFRGKDVSHLKEKEYTILRRENVGFIFQSFNLMNILTAQENVAMASELTGVSPGEAKKKAMETLDLVGMAQYAKRFPHQLSGGQQQRVSIARALVKQPAIMIADEPTASLDAKNTSDTIQLLIDLNKNFKSVCIVCTHDERVIRTSPRLIYVDDGKIASK